MSVNRRRTTLATEVTFAGIAGVFRQLTIGASVAGAVTVTRRRVIIKNTHPQAAVVVGTVKRR